MYNQILLIGARTYHHPCSDKLVMEHYIFETRKSINVCIFISVKDPKYTHNIVIIIVLVIISISK